MPWIAFAYMSTITYLVTASADARPGGPAKPQVRPIVGRSRNGRRIGSSSHTGSFSQSLVAPSVYPCCEVNHCENTGFEWTHFRKSLAGFWFGEYFISMSVNGPGKAYWPAGPLGMRACRIS